jgi:hypothetical protein
VRQSEDCAGKKNNRGAAIGVSRRPLQKLKDNRGIAPASSKKIAARQSGYRAGLFKNCGAAIRVSRQPLQISRLQKSRHDNWGIMPAKIK